MINTGWFKLVIHLSINLVIYDLCNIYTQLVVCNMKPSRSLIIAWLSENNKTRAKI